MLKTTSPLHMSKSQVMTEEASMISISSWLEEREEGGESETVTGGIPEPNNSKLNLYFS